MAEDAQEEAGTVPSAARLRFSRNAPCPCGSGKKYKKCHLAEDEERARAAGSDEARRIAQRDPVHALDERLVGDILALARRRWGEAFDPEGFFIEETGLDPDVLSPQILSPWAAFHYPVIEGRSAADLFVGERGPRLSIEERTWLDAQRMSYFSIWEVLSTIPGTSITVRDLLRGEERTVCEVSGSHCLNARDVVLARILDHGGRSFVAGCHPRPLPPREGAAVVDDLRSELRCRTKKTIPDEKLRDAAADGTIIALWQDAVEERDERPLPQISNTDGEPLLITTDHFTVSAAADSLRAQLLALPGAEIEDEGDPVRLVFSKAGNARVAGLETTLLGRATLDGSSLRIETNSVARADALRQLVEERCGALVTHRLREHADPVAALGRAAGAEPASREAPPPEAIEAVRQLKARHWKCWVDEPIPALGGLTPRAAARKRGKPRRELELILAEVENREARLPPAERHAISELRRQLGLD